MTSSLAQQLRNLAVPATNVFKTDKRRQSLLFDPKEAASLSKDIVYQIGLEGVKELITKCDKFSKFESTLFGAQSKDFDRNVRSEAENAKLDKAIKKFLILLSPYILWYPAQKSLEWLYFRYIVNEYNRKDLILLVLPYYDSNIFTRVIQTLYFKDFNDPYHFLKTVQKSGTHLYRLDLFYQAMSNTNIIKDIMEIMLEWIAVHEASGNLARHFHFYCSVFCGALDFTPKDNESLISHMLPLLQKGLNSPTPDYAAASYTITAKLLSKLNLSEKLLNHFALKLSDLKCRSLELEATLVLVLLYQFQTSYQVLPEKALNNLCETGWVVKSLNSLNLNGYHIVPFFKVLLHATFAKAVEEDGVLAKKLINNMVKVIEFDAIFIKVFLSELRSTLETDDITDNDWLQKLMKTFESKYPKQLETAIVDILKDDNTSTRKKLLYKKIFGHISESYTSKFKILNDLYKKENISNQEYLCTVANWINELPINEKNMLIHMLCEKLYHRNNKVVSRTLQLVAKTSLGKDSWLQTALKDLFKERSLVSKDLEKCFLLAAKVLLSSADFSWDVFVCVFPMVLLHSRSHPNKIKELLRLPFFKNSKLFASFSVETCKNSKQFEAAIFQHLKSIGNVEVLNDLIDECLSEIDSSPVARYSAAIIIVQMLSDECIKNRNLIKKIFIIFDMRQAKNVNNDTSSSIIGYLQIATSNYHPVKGLIDCLNTFCFKTIDKKLNWSYLDLCDHSGYSELLRNICSLSFGNKLFENVWNFCLQMITDNLRVKLEICLNLSISDVLEENNLTSLLNYIERHLISQDTGDLLDNTVFTYILLLMTNPNGDIRQLAICYFERLYANRKDIYSLFIRKLISYKEEILTDHEKIPFILEEILIRSNDRHLGSILKYLQQTICLKETPIYLKSGVLTALTNVNDIAILRTFCQYFLKMYCTKTEINKYDMIILSNLIGRVQTNIVSQLTLDDPIWQFLMFVLKHKSFPETNGVRHHLQIMLLNQFSKDIYSLLPDNLLEGFLITLCEISAQLEDPEISLLSSKIFKHLDLNAALISGILTEMVQVQSAKVTSTRQRKAPIAPTVDILDTTEWKKGICLLEFIQSKKKIKNSEVLLPLLFDILKRCLDFEEQAPVEYPKQLVLSLILLICSKVDEEIISEKDFNIELVIQCIRASQNPQTHYHALLALAQAAKYVPNEVLHHVMTVFTFMGSTLVRHDDAYSFEVISKIMDTIIPILIEGSHGAPTVSDVLRVFVSAMLDVPEHRRIPLYSKLLNNLKTEKNISLFFLLMLEAELFQGKRDKLKSEKGNLSERAKVAINLSHEFSPKTILQSSVHFMKHLNELPNENEDLPADETNRFVVDISKLSAKQYRHFKYLMVMFLSHLLSSETFVNRVSAMSNQENIDVEQVYKELIISVLSFLQRVQKICDKSANKPEGLYWKTVLHYSYNLLDNVNDLLTPHMFLLVIKGLLVHNIITVKRRALELLNTKLQSNKWNLSIDNYTELYNLVRPTLVIVQAIQEDVLQPEQEILVQTALLSLKLMVKILGPDDPEKFVPILDFVAGILNSGNARDNVLASVILCLAELCIILKEHGIAGLNSFMPAFMKILKSQRKQKSSSMLLLSVVTTLSKLLDSFAAFLSPYLTEIICGTSMLISNWSSTSEDPKSQTLLNKLNAIKKKISAVIAPRILIPIMNDCYDALISKGRYNAFAASINILEELFGNIQMADLAANKIELTSFFEKALQFRSDNECPLSVANFVEDQVVNTLTVFVLKLSESSFRPFYLQLYDWAMKADAKERLITFYHLSERVGQALKGLFVLFAGNIIKHISDLLRQITSGEEIFDDCKKTVALLEYVLKTLQALFTYDSKKFFNRDRFELIMQPLVDLMERDIDGMDALIERNKTLLTPAIVQFSVALADDSLWKEMNYQILLKMRNAKPEVRLMALHCLTEVAIKLRDDFLPLVPETIPFLAELLEDEDEKVEKACQTAIREMEKVLGEPLQKYF